MHDSFAEIAQAALAAVRNRSGVEYADVRVSEDKRDLISLRNREIESMSSQVSAGIGVRVLSRGAWGFCAAPEPSIESAERAALAAAEIAAGVASAQTERVTLAEEAPQVGNWETVVAIDPFAVPIEQRLGDLEAALAVMRDERPGSPIKSVTAQMLWARSRKAFASTEGTRVQQTSTFGGAGIRVVVADDAGALSRSWPMPFDGGLESAGYESIARLDLVGNARRIREEAIALLAAPSCPAGTRTLILDTPQLALQIHESCGHPTECDRALGDEVSLAGASFLTPDRLGRFAYGSPIVNMTADSTRTGGLGTFGWDDEGVPARRTALVSRGVFVGYLSSRETAAALGLGRSAGCMRSESWSKPPIIRMINVSLEPNDDGPSSLDELIADTDDGIVMDQNVSWSIDDLRLNFQFGCEAAWEVKRGKRGRLLRNPIYTGSTPAFWRSCNAIGNSEAWVLRGLASCGKGDPIQGMAVGHGCAPARFQGVEVGATR
jgi:TldD protein